MYEYSDSKRTGAIIKPTGTASSKVIESRSKSYSDLSNKQHIKSNIEEDTHQQEGLYVAGWGRNRFHEYPQAGLSTSVLEVSSG